MSRDLAATYVAASKDDNLPPIHSSMKERFKYGKKYLFYEAGDGKRWRCSKLNPFQREALASIQACAWIDEANGWNTSEDRKIRCMDAYRSWRSWKYRGQE